MPSPATLNVKHHTFLQAIMSRGPLSEEMVLEIYKSLLKVNAIDGFNSFLGEINKELEFVEMELKKVTNQNDGKEYFGMINKHASPQAKLGTRYSSAQISFFKAVMEAILLDPSGEGYIESAKALNLRPSEAHQVDPSQAAGTQMTVPIKMTMSQKEEALELLVKDQWLSRTREGGVSLGTRAYLELRGLFRNLEVPFCEVCNEAAIKAELCQNRDCPVRMHSYCTGRKFRARQARVCSRCQTEWSCAAAEKGYEEDDTRVQSRRPSVNNGSSRRVGTFREPAIREPPVAENGRRQTSKSSQYSARNSKSRTSVSPDNKEEEDEESGNEEEITRLDSDVEREESPPPRKRRLRQRG